MAYREPSGDITFCADLISSGGDDNVFVYLTIPFYAILLVLSTFVAKQSLFYMLIGTWALQLMMSFGEVCSIPETLLVTQNPPLAAMVLMPLLNIIITRMVSETHKSDTRPQELTKTADAKSR